MADPVSNPHSLALESSSISTVLRAFIILTGKHLQHINGLTHQFLEHSLIDSEMKAFYGMLSDSSLTLTAS